MSPVEPSHAQDNGLITSIIAQRLMSRRLPLNNKTYEWNIRVSRLQTEIIQVAEILIRRATSARSITVTMKPQLSRRNSWNSAIGLGLVGFLEFL